MLKIVVSKNYTNFINQIHNASDNNLMNSIKTEEQRQTLFGSYTGTLTLSLYIYIYLLPYRFLIFDLLSLMLDTRLRNKYMRRQGQRNRIQSVCQLSFSNLSAGNMVTEALNVRVAYQSESSKKRNFINC